MAEADVERWHPDHHLVDAILAGSSTTVADLSGPDRSWVVAGLTRAGLTAEDIADRLKPCSLRLVRSIRAEPMTLVCHMYQDEASHFADELRMVSVELTRALADLRAERDEAARVREQRDRMIDSMAIGEPVRLCRRGAHVMDRWNTYVHAKTGKKQCRACRREREQERRDAAKIMVTLDNVPLAPTPADACAAVASAVAAPRAGARLAGEGHAGA